MATKPGAAPPMLQEKDLKMNINPNNYNTKIPSLNEVQKEFGLTDPAKYADQISRANAQAKLDDLGAQRDLVDQNLREGQQALEVDYFNQYRNQKEQNALRGLNAGVESQRANLLQMNQGQQMSKLLTDANREKQNIKRGEARVEIERQAQALELRNNELQRQIDLAFKKGDFLQAENARRMQLDIQKEQTRIQAVQTAWQAKEGNYWKQVDRYFNELDQESKVRMEALENKRFGLQQQIAANEKAMAERNYQLRQQEMANDRWYKQQQLNSAAADRAAAASRANAQKVSDANAYKNNFYDQYDKWQLAVKNGSMTPQEAMAGVVNAHGDKKLGLSDSEYKRLVEGMNDTGYKYYYADNAPNKKKKK